MAAARQTLDLYTGNAPYERDTHRQGPSEVLLPNFDRQLDDLTLTLLRELFP